jgi:hypothetical protein
MNALRAESRAGERQRMHNELSTQQQWARGSERSAAARRVRLKEWGESHYEAKELHENQSHSIGGTPVSAPTIGLSPEPGRFKVVGLSAPATTTTCHSRRALRTGRSSHPCVAVRGWRELAPPARLTPTASPALLRPRRSVREARGSARQPPRRGIMRKEPGTPSCRRVPPYSAPPSRHLPPPAATAPLKPGRNESRSRCSARGPAERRRIRFEVSPAPPVGRSHPPLLARGMLAAAHLTPTAQPSLQRRTSNPVPTLLLIPDLQYTPTLVVRHIQRFVRALPHVDWTRVPTSFLQLAGRILLADDRLEHRDLVA